MLFIKLIYIDLHRYRYWEIRWWPNLCRVWKYSLASDNVISKYWISSVILKTCLMIDTINTRTAKTCFFGGASSNVIGPTVIVPSSTRDDRLNLDKTWFRVSLNRLVLKSREPPSLDIEQVTLKRNKWKCHWKRFKIIQNNLI